ncbi:MAG: CRTAC1 family protein [Isosphaeraceae bacterium]
MSVSRISSPPSPAFWPLVIALVLTGCGDASRPVPTSPGIERVGIEPPQPHPTTTRVDPTTPGRSPIRFRDVTESTGIDFVHQSGNDASKHFPTSLGSGVSLLDYDGDGRLDLYLTTTRSLPLDGPARSAGNRLFRNLGGLRFEDVTTRAGVGHVGFCHGASVGDVDNDGRPDLYLTNLGGNVLYLNAGDGTFRDASAGGGAVVEGWSSGSAFLDYDGDGALDLYVTCYGQWSDHDDHEFCGDKERGLRVICSPFSITPARHYLFKGRGDGTFVETTAAAGVLRRDGRGLGVIAADLNHDGRTDLYVANDGCPNFLFLNRGDGTFEDLTESSGAATNEAGEVQGSMGVDVQDLDGDGLSEILVTNFRGQYNTVYRNHDGRNFQDVTARTGTVKESLPYVGWGCALADFDADGLADMFVVNGEVDDNLRALGQEIDYRQPALVWKNEGAFKFSKMEDPGSFFRINHPARGAAFGDLDDDGDLDVVVGMMDERPAVLVNDSDSGHWARIRLTPTRSNRSAIGARVEIQAGRRTLQRQRKGGDSYLSANDPRLHFGLGDAETIDRLEVHWPSGARTVLENLAVDREHEVVEPLANAAEEAR